MQSPLGNWNLTGRPGFFNTKYKANTNMQLYQNFRPHGHYQTNNNLNCDYQHWCETCDKGFPTTRYLENHKLQHQTCGIDGCQFVAHPKIVTKHIQMQHSTGIFKRIAKLNNPEDIEKWREERKKKYPTIANIKNKEAALKEKIIRGEKMGVKYEKRQTTYKTDMQHKTNQRISQTDRARHTQGKYIKSVTNNRKRVSEKSNLPNKICKAIPSVEQSRTLKPFAGIHSLKIDDDDLDTEIESKSLCSVPIEDDEDIDSNSIREQKEVSVAEPTVCSALTSLMCSYESSEDEDVKINAQGKEPKMSLNKAYNAGIANNCKINESDNQTKISEKANSIEKLCENTKIVLQGSESNVSNSQVGSDNESGPDEVKISKECTSLPLDDTKIIRTVQTKQLNAKKTNRLTAKKYEFRKKNKVPSTLLEKLLHKEIQHERNVILQCVRYVVKNKYFENSFQ